MTAAHNTSRRTDGPHHESNGAGPEGLSIVVPLYNEFDCLPNLYDCLERLHAAAQPMAVEFLLVDDGSSDGTAAAVEKLLGHDARFRILRHAENRGIAAAISTGIAAASHPLVASVDADGSYDPRIVLEMASLMGDRFDLITASPYHPAGTVVGVPPWRLAISRLASRMYGFVMPRQLHCYTSCCRVYRREAFRDLRLRSNGFVGVAELMWYAQRRGLRVEEFPAQLGRRQQGYSKMRVARAASGHLRLIARIARQRVFDRVRRQPHGP